MSIDLPKEVKKLLETDSFKGRSGAEKKPLSASSQSNLKAICKLFDANSPQRTLEVGFALGFSAALFASRHKVRALGATQAVHTAIDPFQKEVWDYAGVVSLEQLGLDAGVRLIEKKSAVVLPALWDAAEQFDMIYIDGSHIFEDVFIDCYYACRLLSDNGIVLFDDSADKHVVKVVKFMRNAMTHAFEEVPAEAYREAQGSVASLKYSVARKLNRTQLTAFRRIGAPDRAWDSDFVNF